MNWEFRDWLRRVPSTRRGRNRFRCRRYPSNRREFFSIVDARKWASTRYRFPQRYFLNLIKGGRRATIADSANGSAVIEEPNPAALATVIPAAEATGRCEIRSSSYVRRRCSPTSSKRCWLAVETGMRAGELAGLRCCDVDPFKKLVRVPQTVWRGKVQTPKAKNSKRDIPIPVEIVNALCEHMGGRKEGFVFATKSGRAWNGDLLLKAASS